jgi:imidazolonepropionase
MSGSTINDNRLWDTLWVNVHLATMAEGAQSGGAIMDGAIAVSDSNIVWMGRRDELTADLTTYAKQTFDCGGQWLTPGLIDCHTHLVFGGNRAKEFEMRLKGASYADIARSGGGIRSTVEATRQASQQELVNSAGARLERLLAEGVTTVEIKSGYGLTTQSELTMLRAAKALQELYGVNISTTFLGAHTIPREYEHRRSEYISLVCDEMLPAVVEQGLADAVDVFCETIGFSVPETEKILTAADHYGLKTKIHADQLADSGGAALAARYNALSADHIEYSSVASIKAMAEKGTVAVILPGAFYFLREQQAPPIAALRENNVAMAIATDANPGSSPTTSLLLMMNMACTFFRMTPEEALAGVTLNAAKALGMADQVGSLEVGKTADFALWNIKDLAELSYWVGVNHCSAVIKDGACVRKNEKFPLLTYSNNQPT